MILRFDALPDPHPTHFGAGGQPDAFGERTYAEVLVPVVIGWLVATSLRAGGNRDADGDRDHRKWGLLYVNPDEPDVFVSQRVGVGVTLDLARPLGWLVPTLILAPGIVIITIVLVT